MNKKKPTKRDLFLFLAIAIGAGGITMFPDWWFVFIGIALLIVVVPNLLKL